MAVTVEMIFYLLWAVLCVCLFGWVLYVRTLNLRRHRDRRAFRDVAEATALFITAMASAGSIVAFAVTAPDWRAFAGALSLGAFLGVGIIMATEGTGRK